MCKNEYIQEIEKMIKRTDDEVMLDFIYKLLKRKEEDDFLFKE